MINKSRYNFLKCKWLLIQKFAFEKSTFFSFKHDNIVVILLKNNLRKRWVHCLLRNRCLIFHCMTNFCSSNDYFIFLSWMHSWQQNILKLLKQINKICIFFIWFKVEYQAKIFWYNVCLLPQKEIFSCIQNSAVTRDGIRLKTLCETHYKTRSKYYWHE